MKNYTSSKVDKPHVSRIACEIVLGTIGTFVGYMLCLCPFVLSNAPRGALTVVAIVAYSTGAIAASHVVYFIGNIGKRRGSYLFTLLGGILGSIAIISIIGNPLSFLAPAVGATIGFNLKRSKQ